MRRILCCVLVAWMPLLATCGCQPTEVTGGGASPQPLAETTPDPQWESIFTRADGWTGADGSATVALPGGRVLWLWGDTWIGPVLDGKHAAGSAMVNNTIAVHQVRGRGVPPEPDAVKFLWSQDAEGKPAAWAVPEGTGKGHAAEWFWPAGARVVASGAEGSDRLLLFMTRLGRRDASDSVWNFESRGTTLLVIDNPGVEPSGWRVRQHMMSRVDSEAGKRVTWGAAVLAGEGEDGLYVFGIDEANVFDKKVLLAQAPAASIEQFETWRFWDGRIWSQRPVDAAPVVSPIASELSMHRLALGGRKVFVMVYSELTLGPRVLCRTAPRPQGPWSEPVELYACPEPATDKRLMVYAAKAHPELSRPGELLISYCVNSTDFWHVAANAHLYRPRFVRVPMQRLEAGK